MRRLCIIAALLICTSETAQAQQLAVRSGDHPTFSRLTVVLPASQSWEAYQTTDSVVVTLPEYAGSFDVADVFLRMNRDRITGIDVTGGTLTLRVNCPCASTAFLSGPLLVIDVADQGTKLLGQPLNGPALISRKRPPATNQASPSSTAALPWIGANSPFGGTSSDKATAHALPLPDIETSVTDRVALLGEIQTSLVAEVANAASIGLLENSYAPIITGNPDAKTSIMAPEELPQVLQGASNNLRITNSMDLPNTGQNQPLDATTAGAACPDANFVSVGMWGQDTGFSAQIGPARNALMNARDHLNKDAAKNLAQLYLYFGFGAEALDVLRLDPKLGVANPHLADIATILERGAIDRQNTLGAYTDCASDIALWASLSFRNIPSATLIDTNAALRALNKLPKHLRLILAPAFSERLLQYGDAESAAVALRSIERLPEDLAPNAVLAQADLAMNAGKSAEAFLTKVIKANTTESPAALVKLVEAKLAADQPLSAQTATLVEAYVQELRGTEMGNQLRRTQVLALSQSEQFEQAFEALDALAPALSPQAGTQLRQAVFEQLAKRAPNLTFLEHTFAHSDATLEGLSSEAKLTLASRLMELGFAAKVQEILVSIPEDPRQDIRQLLAARAAIALQQPFQAQAALIGIRGSDAELLMAQAKEMSGAYREAADLFESNNATEQAVQAAWLSDEWRDLTPPDTPALGAIAKMARAEQGTEASNSGPLERANQALEESNVARTTLQELLREPIVQITPDS